MREKLICVLEFVAGCCIAVLLLSLTVILAGVAVMCVRELLNIK
jgi:hypothetical protein